MSGPATAQLTPELLSQIGNIDLGAALVAAILILFQRRQCLTYGPLPILNPSEEDADSKSKSRTATDHAGVLEPHDSSQLSCTVPVGKTSDDATGDSQSSDSKKFSGDLSENRFVAANKGASFSNASVEGITDGQLLEFAMKNSLEKFPYLHNWLKLQLEKNNALADLQPGKGSLF